MFSSSHLTLSRSELHQCAQHARVRMARHGLEWKFMMPLYVLGHFFGDEWVRRHLFESGFLKPPSAERDRSKHQQVGMHGYQLAEALFNLQGIEGFNGIHYRLLRGEIEPCIGELEAARFLKVRRESFRFVVPQGRRGEDYDLEVRREAGTICCEAKIKLEDEELTEKGVYESLRRARSRNLPSAKPGVIFLRVLGTTTNKELQAKAKVVNGAVQRLFRQATRVVGVVLLTSMYRFSEEDETMWGLWHTFPNNNSNYPTSLLEGFQNEHIEPSRENWTYLIGYHPRFVFDWG
jgi:hypothetical protein